MKKMRKGKKMLLIALIVLVVILAIVLVVNIVNKITEKPEVPEKPVIVQLPETTYSNMQVENIVMELLKGNSQDGRDETLLTFDIRNTTDKKVESQFFEAVLIGADENIIDTMKHNYIQELEVGETHRVNVVYKGDATGTTQIKLIEE